MSPARSAKSIRGQRSSAAMGCDFELIRLRGGVKFEPPRFPDDLDEKDVVAVIDPVPLLNAVRTSEQFVPGSLTLSPAGFRWRTPDGGLAGRGREEPVHQH